MKLSVLGRYSPFPRAGGACPGYLIQSDETNLLLECGSGTLSRLAEFIAISELDHVIVSHLHGDHCADLAILRYAADYDVRTDARAARDGTPDEKEPAGRGITVYAPGEPEEDFRRIAYKEALFSRAMDAGDTLEIGPFRISFARTEHPLFCLASRIECEDKTLVYTADTAYCDAVLDLAQDADLLLAEASLPEGCQGFRGHMTASEAGRLGRESGASRLVLTHFWPEADLEEAAIVAARETDGPVEVAVEGRTYHV